MLRARLLPLLCVAVFAAVAAPACPTDHAGYDCLYLPGISPGSDYACGGGTWQPGYEVYKGDNAQPGYFDGDYWNDHTIIGHVIETGGNKRIFDQLYMEDWQTELCFPLEELDWNGFGWLGLSPETSSGFAGYATGMFDCLFGQALIWEYRFEWRNAAWPAIHESHLYSDCAVVRNMQGAVC